MNATLDIWHKIVQTGDSSELSNILADDVIFHSPVVHTPQKGKLITSIYLGAAGKVLFNESFRYVREVVADNSAILEFIVDIDGININGVDMIQFNDEGKISDFKVMIRPLKGVNKVHLIMKEQLEKMS